MFLYRDFREFTILSRKSPTLKLVSRLGTGMIFTPSFLNIFQERTGLILLGEFLILRPGLSNLTLVAMARASVS